MPSTHYRQMKLELKTENDYFSKEILSVFLIFISIFLIVIISNISLKLGVISRDYEINYLCRLLTVDKSSSIFRKLSKLSNQNSKQKVWDLCREIIK